MAGAWPPTEYLAFLSLRLVSKRGWDHSQHCVLGSHSAGGWGGGGAAPWRARSHAPRLEPLRLHHQGAPGTQSLPACEKGSITAREEGGTLYAVTQGPARVQ